MAEFASAVQSITECGYAICPGAIPAARLRKNATAIEAVVEPGRDSARGDAVYGARGLLEQPEIRKLADSDAMLALAQALLGPSARSVKATLFDKRAGANWQVGWHQDLTVAVRERRDVPGFSNWTSKAGVIHAEAPDDVLARMVALRLHIDDCGPENGPLAVIPRSHTRGRLGADERQSLVASSDPAICLAVAGDVLAMRPLILHRSSPATSPTRRRVLHIEYAAVDLPGGLRWNA